MWRNSKGLDIVAMPSLWEACPLLPMEAMVAGVPIVDQRTLLGLREVLQDTPATVVPAKDSFALSKALAMEMKNSTTAKAKEFATEATVRFQVKERAMEIEQLILNCFER